MVTQETLHSYKVFKKYKGNSLNRSIDAAPAKSKVSYKIT